MIGEVLEYLNPQPNQNFFDCTLGGGGYTREIAKRIQPNGKLLSIDQDELAIEESKFQISRHFGGQANFKFQNVIIVKGNFKNIDEIVKNNWKSKKKFDGIVYDLGLSSAQLDDKNRGFSFKKDSPLNMAFGDESRKTEIIINKYKQDELEKIIREYGEEKFARKISENIFQERKISPIKTTEKLVDIIKNSIPKKLQLNTKIHFATRTFQALRIATNDELNSLQESLPQAVDLLKKGGRVVVVSYHSLEDRIVKKYLKKESRNCLCPSDIPICQCGHKAKIKIITKKPIIPNSEEIRINPRARSAKLRVAEKI